MKLESEGRVIAIFIRITSSSAPRSFGRGSSPSIRSLRLPITPAPPYFGVRCRDPFGCVVILYARFIATIKNGRIAVSGVPRDVISVRDVIVLLEIHGRDYNTTVLTFPNLDSIAKCESEGREFALCGYVHYAITSYARAASVLSVSGAASLPNLSRFRAPEVHRDDGDEWIALSGVPHNVLTYKCSRSVNRHSQSRLMWPGLVS